MDLFQTTVQQPLSEQLRPHTLSEVVGQSHLLAAGKPLQLAFAGGHPHSMILWGPPGVGKTTLARLMADAFDCEFIALSAVFGGVKDIRQAVEKATQYLPRHTIVFVDEIHRFNKAQQDALLPYVESGLITFIGATTENPSFSVNAALLSRAQVYTLQSLTSAELQQLFNRAQAQCFATLTWDQAAVDLIIQYADGDARRFLNLIEQLVQAAHSLHTTTISLELAQNTGQQNGRRFDKNGDYFYDQISALHKSVRGSDPDAALYWFCRMVDGGVDVAYLSRRIIRMAWEDIALADPRAMQIANDAAQTYERLGSPEGELALAQAVIYLACASKSNAGYKAFNQAMQFVKQSPTHEVPTHLRHISGKINGGQGYRYSHDEPYAYSVGQTYFPDQVPPQRWYQPVNRGLEQKIQERLAFLRALNPQHPKT